MLRSTGFRFSKCLLNSPKNIISQINKTTILFEQKKLKSDSQIPKDKKTLTSELNPVLLSLLETTQKSGVCVDNLRNFLVSNQNVFYFDMNDFPKQLSTLLCYGFEEDMVIQFIKQNPDLFKLHNEVLYNQLELWRKVGFTEKQYIDILSHHPQLIECMGKEIMKRLSFLLPYFSNFKNLHSLFINVPEVVYENWFTLKSKLDYLHSIYIPFNKLAKCSALKLSLREIKCRFTFLERTGVYKQEINPNKKKIQSDNPTIYNILCTNDKLFAQTIAGVSLLEYEVFCELYYSVDVEEDEDDESEYDSK